MGPRGEGNSQVGEAISRRTSDVLKPKNLGYDLAHRSLVSNLAESTPFNLGYRPVPRYLLAGTRISLKPEIIQRQRTTSK